MDNKKNEDFLEGFFDEIAAGLSDMESTSDFAKRMQESVQSS